MAFGYPQAFGKIRGGEFFPGCHKMFDLVEYPWITNGGPSDHYPVYSVFFPVFYCSFRCIHIAVPKYRDVDSRIIFDFGQIAPIRLAFIHLLARASVNGYGLDAYIL